MKKLLLFFTAMFLGIIIINAQNDSMYIMKDGYVVKKYHVNNDLDSMIFYAPPVAVTGVSISPATPTVLVGGTVQLTADIVPSNATDNSVVWESLTPSFATIDASGLVSGVSEGTATIKVTTNDGNFTAQVQVNVTLIPPCSYMSGYIPNAAYIGRWERKPVMGHTGDYDVSTYTGAQVKVKFTGTTFKLKVAAWASNQSWFYSIDGAPFVKPASCGGGGLGTVDLTPTPLAEGTHDLTIIASIPGGTTWQDYIIINGYEIDPGAQTLAPNLSSNHVEFIGDSITTLGYELPNTKTYGFLIGESLGVVHTHIAKPGIGLSGMASTFFQTNPEVSTPWDFGAVCMADVVVVNLGHNDGGNSPASAYKSFFEALRFVYPYAEILGIGLFNTSTGNNAEPSIIQAVNELNAAGDSKVHYVPDTKGIAGGTTHPDASQHVAIAGVLGPIIQSYLP
jgi:hypothetical protein